MQHLVDALMPTSTSPPNKLFLLDALALLYRAHFAFSKNPRINSQGMNTGAILGFTNSLVEILKKENPTHIAVAFDCAAPTFRHQAFEAYKAHREAQPEDITQAIPYAKKLCRPFRFLCSKKRAMRQMTLLAPWPNRRQRSILWCI